MSSIARYAIVLALSLTGVGFDSAVHSQTKTAKKTPTGSVSGRVTIHGKGVAGIIVGIRSLNPSQQPAPALKATTDPDGNYRVADILAGNYQVTPMAPVYITADQLSARARGKPLLVAEGEDVQGVDFSLVRGGVITGRVTDADGRPLIDERLTVVPENQPNQPGQMFAPVVFSSFQTDDRGIYRIYGVPPGRFKISVGLTDDNFYSGGNFARVAYKRTFYPDTTDPNEAKVIEIAEGAEATQIDITVGRSLPAFSASGKIVDGETGQPVTGLRVALRRIITERESPMMNGIVSASNSLGEFRLENITPGKYAVLIVPFPGNEVRVDATTFEVIDQDVTGLVVKTLKGLTVTGTVMFDGTYDKNLLAKLAELRLQAYVNSETANGDSWQESAINADGDFRLGGLSPGTANFSLNAPNRRPAPGFSILRVERDGMVQPRGVEIKSGEQITGVKVIVSYGTGSIRGEVKTGEEQLPEGGRIMVWIKKSGDTSPIFRPYNVDSRGHFLIEGLAAGSYELSVNANIPGRRGPGTSKQTIIVSDDAVSDIVVTLDLKPIPGQTPNP